MRRTARQVWPDVRRAIALTSHISSGSTPAGSTHPNDPNTTLRSDASSLTAGVLFDQLAVRWDRQPETITQRVEPPVTETESAYFCRSRSYSYRPRSEMRHPASDAVTFHAGLAVWRYPSREPERIPITDHAESHSYALAPLL